MRVIFGGTGGLGTALRPYLEGLYLGSKDVDLRDSLGVRDFFKENAVDEVVNLAGCKEDGFLHRAASPLSMIDLNILGTLNLLCWALPEMRKRDHGRIVLASSVVTAEPAMGTGVYAGTKAFVESIVRTCALENARHHITCNAIRIGYFPVGMTQRIPQWEAMESEVPLGRFGLPEELAAAITFLLTTEYVTGTTLTLTGGL
jgi:3-oxoacyl-[acyl-carrier protein] reductase